LSISWYAGQHRKNDLSWSLDFLEFRDLHHVAKWPLWANWHFLDSHWLIICWSHWSLSLIFEFTSIWSISSGTLIPSYEASSVACVHFLSCACTFLCTLNRAILKILCKLALVTVQYSFIQVRYVIYILQFDLNWANHVLVSRLSHQHLHSYDVIKCLNYNES